MWLYKEKNQQKQKQGQVFCSLGTAVKLSVLLLLSKHFTEAHPRQTVLFYRTFRR